ncbi:NUDIX domain-containing protein [Streptomyces sp. ISL-44]|uniref:NUDIX hydrolase n=1 Tax=Streptomyces sp. ISL-44 TaxID=2819184 RepID=UPI001BEB7056|nr:NUDIX hydrolase [Streptomyces sp. ISL-44]MBT2543287.1 NUDIX domain-containing protein [Streptomyces sp. ISL-44]
MISLFNNGQLDELVIRTHSEGITELAAAALIEHGGRFLLIEAAAPDFDTPPAWELPTGSVWAGETLVMGMHRVLAEHFGFSSAEVDRYLGHNDHLHDHGKITRVFVFAVTVEHPDSICQSAHLGHRWIDSISISTIVNDIDGMLRVYYADNT